MKPIIFNRKKDKHLKLVLGKLLDFDSTVDLVKSLYKEKEQLKDKTYRLEKELEAIKPILESKEYTPALSEDCGDCKYVVRNPFNRTVVGCRKNNLCAFFVKSDD